VHLARRRRSDAMKPRHRQVHDEGFPFVGHDGELPVWFLMVRGELGEKLVVGDSGRGRETATGLPLRAGSSRCSMDA
jgi:hypothetical protein